MKLVLFVIVQRTKGKYLAVNYPNNVIKNKNKANDILYSAPQLAYYQNRPFHREPGEAKNIAGTRTIIKKGKEVTENLYGFKDGHTYVWEVEEKLKEIEKVGRLQLYTGICELGEENKIVGGIAPWMAIALEEAASYGGHAEGNEPLKSRIQKSYFPAGNKSEKDDPTLDTNAWCACFASYVLIKSGY